MFFFKHVLATNGREQEKWDEKTKNLILIRHYYCTREKLIGIRTINRYQNKRKGKNTRK